MRAMSSATVAPAAAAGWPRCGAGHGNADRGVLPRRGRRGRRRAWPTLSADALRWRRTAGRRGRAGVLEEVGSHLGDQMRRDGHVADPGGGFGRADHVGRPVHVGDAPADPQPAAVEVYVFAAQLGDLTEPQPAPRREQDRQLATGRAWRRRSPRARRAWRGGWDGPRPSSKRPGYGTGWRR